MPAFPLRRTLLAMLGLLLPVAAVTEAKPRRPAPHIVVFLADDLGWGDVGFHGSRIATPHIDALAHGGVRLEQFYVQPVCSPTRGALLTGRYPLRLGLQVGVVRPWAKHGLPLGERTLAEALRETGYATAICGKWHLGHGSRDYLPTRRGFDRQYGLYNGAINYFTHDRDGGHDWHENDAANHDQGYATDLIANAAVKVIAGHDTKRPLFLYVPFNAPHTPLQAPESYIEQYAHIPDQRRRIHAAMVACMDDAIGKIQGALDEHGFKREETLVFFCSDNGGMTGYGSNGELRGQKGQLYEGGIRVPAVISWPGTLTPGAVVDAPLHVADLYPTLLKLAGGNLEQKHPLDGRDAWPAIADGKPTPHDVIVHNVTPWSGALRMGHWKLVHNGSVQANATKGPHKDTFELFDIAADPNERTDLSSEHTDILTLLRGRLDKLREAAAPPNIPPNNPPAGFVAPQVWGEPRPNIILINADDLGYAGIGCYGQKLIQTPRIDAMAAEGMRFTDYYAANTVCVPSRYSLITGLGTGSVTLNAGTLRLYRITAANALIVNGGKLYTQNGFGNSWNGPVTLNATLPIEPMHGLTINGAIEGAGGLTIQTQTNTVTLTGANSYTGPTSVTKGTLKCNSPGSLGGGALSINGGKLNLNYVGTRNVASLTLGGVAKTTPGTYGSVASLATFQDDTYFIGTGTVTVGGASDYDTWLGEFTFAPGADTTPTGDPDGDNLSNQDEYAFGLNPTLGSSVNPIVAPLDPLTGNFQYPRRATPAATGLTYSVLTSTDLAGWAPGGATETGFTTAGNIQTVTVNVTAPPVGGKLFVRVQAAPTP